MSLWQMRLIVCLLGFFLKEKKVLSGFHKMEYLIRVTCKVGLFFLFFCLFPLLQEHLSIQGHFLLPCCLHAIADVLKIPYW